MNKFLLALKSRTFWAIVIIVGLNTIPQLKDYLSQSSLDTLTGILGALATYFHVSPSQNYTGAQES